MLDLWQNDANAIAAPQPGEATDVPAGFGEKFAGEWAYNQAVSGAMADENARNAALGGFIDQIKQAGGGDAFNSAYAARVGNGDVMLTSADALDVANSVVAQLRQANPSLQLQPISADELNRRAIGLQQGAQATYSDLQARGSTLAGKLGALLGGFSAAAAEPQNIAAMAIPIGGELGYLRAALAGAGLFSGSQAVSEAVNPNRAQVIPGYSPAGAIGEAAVEGAALGAGGEAVARGLGALWTRFKTGAWPTSVRDAGNIVESEANIQATNVLPGADGEVAHRDALAQSVDQVLNGKPVDVDVARGAQALMARLQSERPFALPVADLGELARTSEEASLRERGAAIAGELASLAPGDSQAAETLARVKAEQSSIDDRLADIAAERAKLTPADQVAQPFNFGQTSIAPPTLFDIHAGRIDNLMAMRAAGADLRPALENGVQALGELTGHVMPPDDAKAIASRVITAKSDDEARAILNETVVRPRTIRDTLPSEPAGVSAPMPAVPDRSFADSIELDKTLADPANDRAMQAEAERQLDRLAAEKGDIQIPVGADDKGEPIYRSLADMLDEAKADRDAAAQLEACLTPMSEAAE